MYLYKRGRQTDRQRQRNLVWLSLFLKVARRKANWNTLILNWFFKRIKEACHRAISSFNRVFSQRFKAPKWHWCLAAFYKIREKFLPKNRKGQPEWETRHGVWSLVYKGKTLLLLSRSAWGELKWKVLNSLHRVTERIRRHYAQGKWSLLLLWCLFVGLLVYRLIIF